MNDWPAQIAPEFTVIIGLAFTVKFLVAEPIQPAAVPVNEYEVFDAGDNDARCTIMIRATMRGVRFFFFVKI